MSSFLKRRWLKLLVGAVAAVVLIGAGAFALVSMGFFRQAFATPPFIKESKAFSLAMARLSASPGAAQALGGAPLDEGAFFEGTIEEGETSGQARFKIDVLGPKGHGSLLCEAVKADGEWHYKILELNPSSGGKPVNLLLEASPKDVR